MPASVLPPTPRQAAWRDAPTRRAVALYMLRALGLLVAAPLFSQLADLTVDSSGDAKAGIPGFVPFIFIVPAMATAVVGVFSLLNVLRITWVVARRPWLAVQARFEEVLAGKPNGQPVLHLSTRDDHWTLTLAAFIWRWNRFGSAPTLLLAASPGRGGVVATPDRRSIAWAGRSAYTAFLLWRRR